MERSLPISHPAMEFLWGPPLTWIVHPYRPTKRKRGNLYKGHHARLNIRGSGSAQETASTWKNRDSCAARFSQGLEPIVDLTGLQRGEWNVCQRIDDGEIAKGCAR